MSPDKTKETIIDCIDYVAYRETDSSLHDSDKNRLFGSTYYNSGRPVYESSAWAEGDFEEKMATLLHLAGALCKSDASFEEAQQLLQSEDSVLGRVIRRSKDAAFRPVPLDKVFRNKSHGRQTRDRS